MKKLINYLITRKSGCYNNSNDIIKNFKNNMTINNKLDISHDELFENILFNHINQRCEELSLTKLSNTYTNNDNLYIKLYGDKNYFFDNSKFLIIKNKNNLNYRLRLAEDLLFSNSDIYMIFNKYSEFYSQDNFKKTEIQSLLLQIVLNSRLKTLNDLKELIEKLFNINIEKKV